MDFHTKPTGWYICTMSKATREKIVQKCFEAIREHGFTILRTDKEIQRLRITKGAFYHYFPGKMDLGYAVIDEVILPMYLEKWASLENCETAIGSEILAILEREKMNITEMGVARGDVLSNLMLEMSHEDELFRKKLEFVLESQEKTLQKAILTGKAAGEFKASIDARSMAYSIIGQLQGCFAIAKTRNSKDVFTLMINTLQRQIKEVLFVQNAAPPATPVPAAGSFVTAY
jgi:AcrR family transcriptional regulator